MAKRSYDNSRNAHLDVQLAENIAYQDAGSCDPYGMLTKGGPYVMSLIIGILHLIGLQHFVSVQFYIRLYSLLTVVTLFFDDIVQLLYVRIHNMAPLYQYIYLYSIR